MIMVVNSIEVTHSFEMNCCNDLYDEAIAVVYVEAEWLDMHTDRLLIRKMFESIAKFDKKICYGNILKILAEHSSFWNCVHP